MRNLAESVGVPPGVVHKWVLRGVDWCRADHQAGYFVANIHRIVQRSRKQAPFVDIVHPDRVERRWPR